jgi:hypothetical protein
MLLLFAGSLAISLRPDDERNRKLLAASGEGRADPPLLPRRRYSVAWIEEHQRASGATVEYVDDLSAALANSPVFRASIGLDDDHKISRRAVDWSKAGARCTICGVGNNCCGTGGSWAGTCPTLHSYDEGHVACIKDVLKAEPKEEKKPSKDKPAEQAGAAPGSMDRDALATHGNTQRCGYSWNDAAAKCGPSCPYALQSECNVNAPKLGQNSTWKGKEYKCFADLPPCNPKQRRGACYSLVDKMRDELCTTQCNARLGYCDPTCVCEEPEYSSNPAAPIGDEPKVENPKKMKEKTAELVKRVKQDALQKPGLPNCRWRPGTGCTNSTPYECVDTGKCSAKNWFEDESCETPCLHESLLPAPPYSALWRPGPMHPPWENGTKIPHYEHENMKDQLEFTRKHSKGSILMSKACKLETNTFVGISMFSPNYESKARRLLASCERVTVCCKATLLPPDAFGPDAPEGSEEFRFRVIAIKPAFILSQLKATGQPVVFLDTDFEFHQFPRLFTPGSWPQGDRDVALFNYWGNETNITNRNDPHTGSGVAYFNQTLRSKKLLVAWAEAMAFKHNQKAPDDQVLDKLLTEGGWLARLSFGWLPAAYMRNPPAFYRGVDCVIDHDHGNPPGLLKHSTVKPQLPPVAEWETVTDDAENTKCLSVEQGISDQWCTHTCNYGKGLPGALASQMCPTTMCVCDWNGDWPEDDAEGFDGWDLGSLGLHEPKGSSDLPGDAGDGPCPGHPHIKRKSVNCADPAVVKGRDPAAQAAAPRDDVCRSACVTTSSSETCPAGGPGLCGQADEWSAAVSAARQCVRECSDRELEDSPWRGCVACVRPV